MSHRLPSGGRLIDRSKPLKFRFNDRIMRGFQGDTLASALLANDQMLVGRSFKYHRPRGIVAGGAEEPNALMNLGKSDRLEPNQRATTTELFDGLTARSQNHWPSLEWDVGIVNNWLSNLLPAGFYYKMFIHPRAAWKHIFEPFIRQSAGLGQAPTKPDPDTYEHFYAHVDVLIVGGGIAGLTAARAAAASGATTLVLEQSPFWGGRATVDGEVVDDQPAEDWIRAEVESLDKTGHTSLRLNTMAAGIYDHGYVIAYERIADTTPGDGRPRHRLWRIRAKRIVTATGAIERPLSFAGNDIPGVMLASAVRDYAVNHGVVPGKSTVVVTNNDDAYCTAKTLLDAGLSIPRILDTRGASDSPLVAELQGRGVRIDFGRAIAKAKGVKRLHSAAICDQAGDGTVLEDVPCDAVAMSGGWSPVVHLWSHTGGKLIWDDAGAMFRPDADRAPTDHNGEAFVLPAGTANGVMSLAGVLEDAHEAGAKAAREAGFESTGGSAPKGAGLASSVDPVWLMPANAKPKLRKKTWLDFQNDVKVSDVQLAAQEGYQSVEHTKRYTTLGMATDQGKLSNINGLATLSNALDAPIPKVGTTTFRPPYTPISMGSIAGEARGSIFQPLRRTPLHDWHDANGAHWEPVGHWRRPYCFRQKGESVTAAVNREVKNTREALGLLDASTLGKILVKGPDAVRFLDMMYTNMMSTLKPGRCRYGLMCSENGFLIDDGVVARVGEDSFLCHTTTGGADRIHAHMEEWLQTEWWDWKVCTVNLTEQFAQIAVVGPNARKVLEKLGGMDVSAEALPFMAWADGQIGGFKARVYRISFSGELSYEIAVPAGTGRAFWDALLDAGAEFGVMPYGTEALHIMRAEKGFIMIGDETDGTVIPQDLGLNWAISKKKDDYLGKRAQERSHMTDPDRWKLVGLETTNGGVLEDGAYAPGTGFNGNAQANVQGRVTSTYFSPTLGRGIAMGLVHNGPDRMGEVI
ncbi:MAG: sarcosine oxidase subunit alpha family protein, partial [Pseudomonadota bacterium]